MAHQETDPIVELRLERDLTLVALRSDDEVVLRHHILVRIRTELGTNALAEEQRRRAAQLHIGEVDAQARVGACTEGAEGCFGGLGLLDAWEPAVWVEAVR